MRALVCSLSEEYPAVATQYRTSVNRFTLSGPKMDLTFSKIRKPTFLCFLNMNGRPSFLLDHI